MNLKKVVSLILSLLFLTVPVSYASEAENGYDYIKILEDINVIDSGIEISNANYVTRAEFIRMVVNILCDDVEDYNGTIPFSDVKCEDENYKYIRTAYEYGIISGDGTGKFNPNTAIEYNHAVKILVDLLGYKKFADLRGGYKTGYLSVASEINLTKSIKNINDKLPGEDAAKLIFNALNTETATINFKDSEYSVSRSGIKLMTEAMDIYSVSGILTANEFTGLFDVDGAGKETINIGGIDIKIYNSIAPEKYIGYDVECYYRNDDNGNTALSIIPTNKNNVTEIEADQFEEYTADIISYTKDEKTKRIHLSDNFYVIYNGKIKDDYTENTFKINNGYITAIDNNGDGKADVINVESYKDYVISSIDEEEKIIYDFYGKTLDVSDDLTKSTIFVDEKGNEIFFSDLQKGNTVSVMADDEFQYIRGIVETTVISGKIEQVYSENEKTAVNVDGKTYFLSKDIALPYIAEYKVWKTGEFFINSFGNIAYFKNGNIEAQYAMVISVYNDESEDNAYIKFIDDYGAIRKCIVSEKCKINGNKFENLSALGNVINRKEVVLIKIGTDGEIKSIETIDGKILHSINDKVSATYNGAQRWFEGKLSLTENTPIFVYPSEDTTNEEEFFVARFTYLSEMAIKVQGFNQNLKSYLPDVIAVEKLSGSNSIQYNSPNIIVESVNQELDYDDTIIYSIEGYDFEGNSVKYKVKEEGIIDGFNLKAGDMIKIKKDVNDYITYIDKFYDAEKGNIYAGSIYTSSSLNAGFKPYVGYIYEKKEKHFGFSNKNGDSSYDDVSYFAYGTADISVCEINKKVSVKKTNLDALTDYLNDKNPSKIFMYTNSSLVRQIVILK